MKDIIARERIDDLSKQVRDLKYQLQYYDEKECVGDWSRLTAQDIIKRFNELYEYFGIERRVAPQIIKLEKKQ